MGFAGRNKNGLYELQCISKVRPRASPLRLRRPKGAKVKLFFWEYSILYFLLGCLRNYIFLISRSSRGVSYLGSS